MGGPINHRKEGKAGEYDYEEPIDSLFMLRDNCYGMSAF